MSTPVKIIVRNAVQQVKKILVNNAPQPVEKILIRDRGPEGPTGPPGPGVPAGGNDGDLLIKGTPDNQWVTLSGDATLANTGALTIANDAVTYAKMQNVSAASRLLGRGSAGGAGDVEEITLGTGLSMTGTTLSSTGGGATNLSTTLTATTATVNSDTGTDATIPAATVTDAGVMTAADRTKLDGIEAGADVTDATNVGAAINGSAAKTTPVDADTVPLIDSAAGNILKKLSWANIKATLKSYFDTLYPSGSGTSSGTNTGDQNLFGTIAVSGQSNVVADSTSDTLTLVAGTNVTITTDASTDSVTINATGGGGGIGGSTGSTDNAILRADGTGGSTLQASPATMMDTGAPTFFDTITLNKTGQAESAGLEVADDPLSPSARALFILPPAVSGRIYLGKPGLAPFAINFDGAASLESVPAATFDSLLTVGGVESHSIDRNSDFVKLNSSSPTGGGFWLYAGGSAYNNTYVAANLVSRIGNLGAKTIELYEAYTDDSNYERLLVSAASGTNVIKPEAAGTGTASKLDLYLTDAVKITSGTGSPEGAVTAPVGSIYSRTDGGTNTTIYRKESGTGNTGWVAVSNAGGGGGISDGDTLSIGLTFPNTGLHILDTNASHDLIIAPGSDLSADRTLTVATGDANRVLTLTGDASIAGTNTGDVSVSDTDTIDLTITGQALSAAVRLQQSLTSDASGVKLSGDSATPGNSKYYGTNGSGTKGFHDLPAGGGSSEVVQVEIATKTDTQTTTANNGTWTDITDLSITVTTTAGQRVVVQGAISVGYVASQSGTAIRLVRAGSPDVPINSAADTAGRWEAGAGPILTQDSNTIASLVHGGIDVPGAGTWTYKYQFCASTASGSATAYINRSSTDTNTNPYSSRAASFMRVDVLAP